jgi:CRISPR-associated protein (TIGR02710 family)
VVTPDEQDLGESVFTLLREVPLALKRLGAATLDWPQFVDYTAGTKTMSAALILASSKFPCQVAYIGAPDPAGRTKEGLGIVLDGKERIFRQENPWNRIACYETQTAAHLFNRGQYGNAAHQMKRIVQQVTEDGTRRVLAVLAELFEGFHRWDIFDHAAAQVQLGRSLQPLLDLAESPTALLNLKPFAEQVRDLSGILRRIRPRAPSWDLIHDLLANALRRAELEQKYEDATARCYSAIERIAQHQLKLKYCIDPCNARAEQLPGALREEYVRKYTTTSLRQGCAAVSRIQFGLAAAFELLAALEDPVGRRFRDPERNLKIRSHLDRRNRSILAHGLDPMDYEAFRAVFEDALYLLDIEESALWRFPTLEI